MTINHNNFLKLAFNIAKLNLGKTNSNPSVGCVVVKNNSVISIGKTSFKGRPHAEFNALNKHINFKDSTLYTTLEPCTHFGVTPPCTNIIIKKKIKRVYYAFNDVDTRTANKANKVLIKNKIKVKKKAINKFKDFYQSYLINKKKLMPLIDAKLAISKDYYSINKRGKWITNNFSRKRAHLIRSEYDLIISTSKSINKDNSLLNCRLSGLDNNKPDLAIIDLKLKLKKNLNLIKKRGKRKIFIVTLKKNDKKTLFFRNKGIKIIYSEPLNNRSKLNKLYSKFKEIGYNRILIEAGLIFLRDMIEKKIVSNLFLFKSNEKLDKNGLNNTSNIFLKKIKLSNRISVNLFGEKLFKIKVNNV